MKPSLSQTEKLEAPVKDGAEAAPLAKDAVVAPAAEPQAEQLPRQTEPAKEGAEAQDAAPANAGTKANGAAAVKAARPRTAKKPIAQRSRTAKQATSRTASRTTKSQAKFAPFDGMLSGLLSPPANKRTALLPCRRA